MRSHLVARPPHRPPTSQTAHLADCPPRGPPTSGTAPPSPQDPVSGRESNLCRSSSGPQDLCSSPDSSTFLHPSPPVCRTMADTTSLSTSSASASASSSDSSDSDSPPNSSNSSALKGVQSSGILCAALDLLSWRETKRSAAAFAVSLLLLVSLARLSLISVMSYLSLGLLCISITFRVYKSVVQAVQKSDDGHPYKSLLDWEVSVPPEASSWAADRVLVHLNRALVHARKLLLVEDLVDSLKLAGAMWLMTYVGAVFNGLTLLILADIVCFTSPLVYQKYQTQIDRQVQLTQIRLKEAVDRLQDVLPGSVKRTKAD